MVNSGSFDAAGGSEGESVKAEFTQLEDDSVPRSAASPRHLVGACAAEANFTAVVPDSDSENGRNNGAERDDGLNLTSLLDLDQQPPDQGSHSNRSCEVVTKTSLQCSVPLDKVKNVLELCRRNDADKTKLSNFFILENYLKQSLKPNEPAIATSTAGDAAESSPESSQKPAAKRLLCLFCDRTFTSNNLKQKHVDRCHSAGQARRSSSRTASHNQSATACCFCSKLNHTDHTLKELLEHLINEHSNRYFACLSCQERFAAASALRDHNKLVHGIVEPETKVSSLPSSATSEPVSRDRDNAAEVPRPDIKRTLSNCATLVPTVNLEPISSPPNVSTSKPLKRSSSVKSSPEVDKPPEEVEKTSGFVDFEDSIHVNVISHEEVQKSKEPEPDPEDFSLASRKAKNSAPNSKTRNGGKKPPTVNKKISVKSTKNGVRNNLRTTRATVKQISNFGKTRNKNKLVKSEGEPGKQIVTKKPQANPTSVFSLVNAYTYKYEKIYDHSSDSIKDANSVQFNAVFDKEFYSRTMFNIRENLLNHLDGKLNRNVESESRISNFEHNPTCPTETDAKPANDALANFGCDLSLNAVTPVATLLASSQYGEDFDSQIEYGAKASQKKPKKVAVVKYKFPNKKYNSLFRERDSHSDLTCLDMWTQLSVKKRQHKNQNEDVSDSDLLFDENFLYNFGAKRQVEELNRIMDKRGPFEDLRLEANAAQFLELRKKSNKDGDNTSEEASKDVYFIIEELLTRVVNECNEKSVVKVEDSENENKDDNNDILSSLMLGRASEITPVEPKTETIQNLDLPHYLQLKKSPVKFDEVEIDKTDKITLICSSVEDGKLPQNKRIELSGEWARPRIYICATCGLKLPNLKALDDHKNMSHPQIWCTHYEFVGNQSQIYRHLSIPGLGKVGLVESLPTNRSWQRSDARTCSKCTKQCHNLGELHKHILECGGDWTWMLARKKCKYRPYGARSRRRRQRGYKRSCNPEVQRVPREHKPKIKPIFIGPRPKPSKPSDAETIERMLANLPPKRTRKMISMRDGIQKPRKPYKQKVVSQTSPNTQSDIPQNATTKKVHFSNSSPQISTKQTLQNALKRKMTVQNLRNQTNKNQSENLDISLKLRSRVKKVNEESREYVNNPKDADVTQQVNKNRNKRMISRILGSKIFDSSSALVTRRRLVKAITQNNLIRKTRLRSRILESNAQLSTDHQVEDTPLDDQADKTIPKSKVAQESVKKGRNSLRNQAIGDESDSKIIKPEEIGGKISEPTGKTSKKSNSKRLFAVLTKSSKKLKSSVNDKTVENKPDTISAIIDQVVSMAGNDEGIFDNSNMEEIDNKIRNSAKKSDVDKNNVDDTKSIVNEENNETVEPNEKINDDEKPKLDKEKKSNGLGKVIGRKTNKLVQSFRIKRKTGANKTGEKSEGITSKFLRTLSMRSSKRTKKVKEEELKNTIELEAKTVETEFKKTTTENKLDENKSITKNNCDKIGETETLQVESETMPTLDLIEPLPTDVLTANPSENIPILTPVDLNPSHPPNHTESELKPAESEQQIEIIKDSQPHDDEMTDTKSDDDKTQATSALNKFKSKIKRSGRGLNDCIAMLKCKLEQKYQNNEPSLVDKSNLFILNSSEINKHSQPAVQEKIESEPPNPVESTKEIPIPLTNDDTINEKEKDNTNTCDKSNDDKMIINEQVTEIIPSVTNNEKGVVQNANVLEIPSLKIHKNEHVPSEVSTVETQTVDESLQPPTAAEFIPADIQSNIQLSYVLNATLKNCLMECVINKCEELKIETQSVALKSKPTKNIKDRKIGSIRKRNNRTANSKTKPIEKHIPNVPVLLNNAFMDKSIPKKVFVNTAVIPPSAAVEDVSDDDIPLSKFVSNATPCTKLKIKLPIANKKRKSKKKIAFTPLILNSHDNCIPQINLQDNIEQNISLDNSMNNKIEAIQAEVQAAKEKKNEEINANISTACIDVQIPTEEIAETSKIPDEAKNVPSNVEANHEDDSDNLVIEENLSNTEEKESENIQTTNAEENKSTEEIKAPIIEEICVEKSTDEDKRYIDKTPEDISKPDELQPEKDLNVTSEETATSNTLTKELIDTLNPLSHQLMAMEDEPCETYLLNKTLTEANIEPSVPVKINFQNLASPDTLEFINKSSHVDSGKENSEEKSFYQKIKKHKKPGKKSKGKRKTKTKVKITSPSSESENVDPSMESAVEIVEERSCEETDEFVSTALENQNADESSAEEPLVDSFKSQLQSALETEPDSTIMENKNILETESMPSDSITQTTTSAEANASSDSEDELPLALLIKNKQSENDMSNVEIHTVPSTTTEDKEDPDKINMSTISNVNRTILEKDNDITTCLLQDDDAFSNFSTNSNDDKRDFDIDNLIALDDDEKNDSLEENLSQILTNNDVNEINDVKEPEELEEQEKQCDNNCSLEPLDNIEKEILSEQSITPFKEVEEILKDNSMLNESNENNDDFLLDSLIEDNETLQKEIAVNNENQIVDDLSEISDSKQKEIMKTPDPVEQTGKEMFDFLKTPANKPILNHNSDFITTPDLADASLVIKIQKSLKVKIRKPKKSRRRVIPKSLGKSSLKRKDEKEEEAIKSVVCEICNKIFKRKENLASHKRTLTHIAKLSEIEAQENMARRSQEPQEENCEIKDTATEIENENCETKDTANEIQKENSEKKNIADEVQEEKSLEEVVLNNYVQIIEDKAELTEEKEESSNIVDISIEELKIDEDIVEAKENIINLDESSTESIINLENDIENSLDTNEVENLQSAEVLDLEPPKPVANLLPGIIVNSTNSNLKLVDIINQVLDKPVNDLKMADSDYLPGNIINSPNNCDVSDTYSEPKRYKSLGERKSFDSDNFTLPPKCSEDVPPVEPYKSVNNGLLSKQLSLLENIIEETNPNLNYIEDSMSLSSSQFDEPLTEQNSSEKQIFKATEYSKPEDPQIKFSHSADLISNLMKPNHHFSNFENISETFAKPNNLNYDEISEPQIEEEENKKSSKENSTRKILNRDEELFLECCSLLKSGSEISKKSTRQIPLHNFTRSNESWIQQKQQTSERFIQRDSYSWLAQSSRVDTPIGEPFVNNDWSNSNSAVSSEWLAQKAPSPDRPIENNTLVKKNNNNSGEIKYSDIQFEDISVVSSVETSKTLMAVDSSNTENIPLDFHHVDFSSSKLNPAHHPEIEENIEDTNKFETNSDTEVNEDSVSTKEQEYEDEPVKQVESIKTDEDLSSKDEFDAELKKKVVTAFGGLMAKALSKRLHAVVRNTSKKSRNKRDFDSAIQSPITDYTVPAKKNKLSHTDSDSSDCPKKLMTKGAMKIFEGLKVSIPTQDLNLKEVLNYNAKCKEPVIELLETTGKKVEQEIVEPAPKTVEEIPVVTAKKNGKLKNLFGRFGNKLGLRETKKKQKHRSSGKNKNHINSKKSHDVYDFEESMDSNFMFKTGKFSLFRNARDNITEKIEDSLRAETHISNKNDEPKQIQENDVNSIKWNPQESDSDDRYYDSMSFEEMSISSESTHEINLANKIKLCQKKNSEKSTKENQKKCMIMGRIFKNASKPKLEDKIPEIRDFSSEENSKVVVNYLDSCSSVDNVENSTPKEELPSVPNNLPVVNSANKMSEKDLNLLFDKLLEEEKKIASKLETKANNKEPEISDIVEPNCTPDKEHQKNKSKEPKLKSSSKSKKRLRHNSGDSASSDEFVLGARHSKSSKKHHKTPRKSSKAKKEGGINLEQEMKECIGVAGRKSQRKCTSGKQNVLVESWSSDESSVEEEILQLIEKSNEIAIKENKITEEIPYPKEDDVLISNSSLSNSINIETPKLDVIEDTKKNNLDIYEFDSDMESKIGDFSSKKIEEFSTKPKIVDCIEKSENEKLEPINKIKISRKSLKQKTSRSRKHSRNHEEEEKDAEYEGERARKKSEHKRIRILENGATSMSESAECLAVSRKKRNAGEQLYYWSSSSDDEFQDLIEVKPIREDTEDDRPMHHGWIVGDSPKKLVTMLAQAKGKKIDGESVKEQGKKNRASL